MRARGLKLILREVERLRIGSRPMRARGLKHKFCLTDEQKKRSRPMRARGLKHLEKVVQVMIGCWSRPMRARGLKPIPVNADIIEGLSRPMRARGLKQAFMVIIHPGVSVAPHAGAWVETVGQVNSYLSGVGRAPCGRVG